MNISIDKQDKQLSLSVIIPAYNEIENILATLENVSKAFIVINMSKVK